MAGARLPDWFGWGQPIFSSTAGKVIQLENGWPERDPVHPIRDLAVRIKNARDYRSNLATDFRPLTGNFILIEAEVGYILYAHAKTGSIMVTRGAVVEPGQHLANVGHSGNSTAPHLHFQIMDHPDPWKAKGILCGFREYEVLLDGAWRRIENGIPKKTDRIRKL